jgi:signal-transduction protein with cAMP-binding, CBS, and nucleotidyltransferase domain
MNPVLNFYIIISGSVIAQSQNKKISQLQDGDYFGFDSLLFSNPSPFNIMSNGISRIAHI